MDERVELHGAFSFLQGFVVPVQGEQFEGVQVVLFGGSGVELMARLDSASARAGSQVKNRYQAAMT